MEDVVVIGAGIIGVCAALNLAQRGMRVHIVDSAPPGSGCSFGNAGLIAVDHVAPLASPETMAGLPRMLLRRDSPLRLHKRSLPRMAPWVLEFAAQAQRPRFRRNTRALASLVTGAAQAWRRLLDQHIADDLFRDIGSLYVFEQPVAHATERAQLDLLDRHGVRYETLTAEQVRRDYLPSLTPHISHARYFPGMASVTNPQQVVERIFGAVIAAGAKFTSAAVDALRALPDGRIGVTLNGATHPAAKVLIAAGSRSAELAQQLGARIPLTNERGYHVQLGAPSQDTLRVPVSFVERGFTCNPMAQGIRLAGTVELGARGAPDWRRADMLATQFQTLFPGARAAQVASRWYGERPTLPDYLPMIGEMRGARNVFVATGHQHLGLTLGPFSGELVAQLMVRDTPAVDLAPFRIDRF
ncbi:FAD-dependent oxidoreductase [Paraburkholderia guartelaensis]|uniref:FAD-dependent oxidoreductase n=1 Tax=Paraburkholderia guartelaensis TaxID=2546446 RepID=A0A4R5LKQ1_9BURK|nr:FAD-dependent oxidoreductase [Paraburkholderia guartelaensis]TDG10304.1 FAD-dependent oxidoreductase [Paraburkholderia guartelaensis]